MSGGAGHIKFCADFQPSSKYLRSKHPRVLRPGIASFSENSGFTETSRSKLFEEGTAFLGSSNSGKPVGFAVQILWREGFVQDQFGGVDFAALPNYPCKFAEDCTPFWIQVEDPICQRYINHSIFNR